MKSLSWDAPGVDQPLAKRKFPTMKIPTPAAHRVRTPRSSATPASVSPSATRTANRCSWGIRHAYQGGESVRTRRSWSTVMLHPLTIKTTV